MTSILMETTRSSDACQRLVQRALDGGGRDNVTVMVAAYRLPEGPPGTKEKGESANSREGPTAETSRPLSPDDDHQLLFDQIATATERCELVSRRA